MNKPAEKLLRGSMVALLSLGLLTACGGDMSDLNQYIAEVKARPAQPIEPIPPVKTYSPYPYEGLSGRDPFRSSSSEGNERAAANTDVNSAGPRPDFDRPKEFLERFELDTLSMVGTFSDEDNYWGLVTDPDGEVHRVQVNDYLGKNHGQIVTIDNMEIGLSELINDGAGGWLVREASIALDGS
jgi:type IV pilus assembly protein PilP